MVIFAASLCFDKGTVVPVRRLYWGEYGRFEFGFDARFPMCSRILSKSGHRA